MIERLIDLSDAGARLSVRHDQLVIEREEGGSFSAPLDEVAVVVVSHPAVTLTQAVLSGLMSRGAVFVACDERRLPSGMMLPLEGHHLQGERLEYQMNASQPVRKRAWQQLVKAKIRAQGRLLKELRGTDAGLLALAENVRSGDPDNLEGQAARRYWPLVFGEASFRRDHEASGINAVLNYGYSVLRGIVARAIVAAGLHPSIGVHHHNRYDAFRLADDLVEPFRPLVDRVAAGLAAQSGLDIGLDKETKRALLSAFMGRYLVEREERTLFEVASRLAASLVAVFQGKRKELLLPEW